jgi:hypothetical protein
MRLPNLDIITTISTKYYSELSQINLLFEEAIDKGIDKLLIVSGATKGPIDSVQVFNNTQSPIIELYCVFNPFLEREALFEEKLRLKQKLVNQLIKGVFIQIGTNTQKMKFGVEYIRELSPKMPISASLLFPDEEFLERMKRKPWKDVFFEEEYLNNIHYAKEKTKEISSFCFTVGISHLIQLLPFNEKNIESFLRWQNKIL